jgi:hypothetical protein
VSALRQAALFALIGALLGACAGGGAKVSEARRLQIDPSSCVGDIAQVKAVPVPRAAPAGSKQPEIVPFQFENLARCLLAADGKPAPLALFETRGPMPAEIRIVLMVNASIAFAAAVDLLDAQFQHVRTMPFADFVRRGSSYTGTLFLNEREQDVRYLVFRPDADSVGSTHTTTSGIGNRTPYVIPVPGGFIYGSVSSGVEQVMKTWLSEVGSFSIIASEYRPERLDDE